MTVGRCIGTPRPAGGARRGFVLIELLVAMGVIILLSTLLLGVVMRARHQARDASCKNNLCQLWKGVNYYANANGDALFLNLETPLRISNVTYASQRATGWGHIYPRYLKERRIYFCPCDPVRSLEWDEHGWRHWETEEGEVQCSYGWRGRQGLVADESIALTLAEIDSNPQRVLGCDYYETFTAPLRVHHKLHVNVLRCNGAVEQVREVPSFGPSDEDFEAALGLLDR